MNVGKHVFLRSLLILFRGIIVHMNATERIDIFLARSSSEDGAKNGGTVYRYIWIGKELRSNFFLAGSHHKHAHYVNVQHTNLYRRAGSGSFLTLTTKIVIGPKRLCWEDADVVQQISCKE